MPSSGKSLRSRCNLEPGRLERKDAQIDALVERVNALERQARGALPEHLASAMR
jgi:hypothetical protein